MHDYVFTNNFTQNRNGIKYEKNKNNNNNKKTGLKGVYRWKIVFLANSVTFTAMF